MNKSEKQPTSKRRLNPIASRALEHICGGAPSSSYQIVLGTDPVSPTVSPSVRTAWNAYFGGEP